MMSQRIEEERTEVSDHFSLDQVLNKLYDFGKGTGERRKKKSAKKLQESGENARVEELIRHNGDKGAAGGCVIPTEPSPGSGPGTCGVRNTIAATKQAVQVETVTFQDPLKKRKKTITSEEKIPQPKEIKKMDSDEFSLEKARLEVHRFGITGYRKEQQRHFEQERAIMLGAKPPKKECVNYKVYQQMLKEKKLNEKEKVKLDITNNKKKRENKLRQEKKPSSSALPSGQVGRFKNGMLVLNSKEIQMIKGSRVVK